MQKLQIATERPSPVASISRRASRERRAMIFASGIAGCMAVVALIEAVLLVFR